MGLHILQRCRLTLADALQGSELIDEEGNQLIFSHRHLSAAKALQIRITWVCPHHDTMFFSKLDRLLHHNRIRGMHTASDISHVQIRHHLLVVA